MQVAAIHLLDTCVWRDAATDRAWLRRLDAAGGQIGVCDEVVQELVSAALSTKIDDEFEEARLACVLIRRYAAVRPPPVEWHLAGLLGVGVDPPPQPLAVVEAIVECRSRAALHARARDAIQSGGGLEASLWKWPRNTKREKEQWAESITSAIESGAPGIMAARREGRNVRIAPEEYARLKGQIESDTDALLRIEVERMRRRLGIDDLALWGDLALRARLRAALAVFAAVFTEALLDRFDGAHNDGMRKARLEPNDWFDLGQLRYVQPGTIWVTSERRWPPIARRAGVGEFVMAPQDVVP